MFDAHPNYWERNGSENLIDEPVARLPILIVVRAIVEFDRDHWSEIGVAKNEINVLPIDPIEVRLPGRGPLFDMDQVGKPDSP